MTKQLFWNSLAGLILIAGNLSAGAADQPQWGQAWSRNMVSSENNLPDSFDPKTGRNIKWIAKLGTQTHSTPIVAGGRIFIGSNNGEPRDPKHQGDRGVFMCFEEKTGKFLWQLVVPKRDEDAYMDWPQIGMSSTATVENNRVYLLNNRGTVMCLDAEGMADGNDGPFRDEGKFMTSPHASNGPPPKVIGAQIQPEPLRPPADGKFLEPGPFDADILWSYDLVAEAGVWPHDGPASSILIHGDYLYLNTSTGVDNTHTHIRRPDAPSLVVLDKRTGKLVARDQEKISPDIFHATWCSPSLGEVHGRPQVFFGGGNGVIYAFEPVGKGVMESGISRQNSEATAPQSAAALRKIWSFDFDQAANKENIHKYNLNRQEGPSNLYGMPVFHKNRLYVAGGGDLWWGKNEAWLKCINVLPDSTRASTGSERTRKSLWMYRLEKHVMSTPAVSDGLVFIADTGRTFHCVDAETGEGHWTAEIKGEVWGSPMVADKKVYLGTRGGSFYVFAASKEKKILSSFEMGSPISGTVTPANGVLYVATMNQLFAVQSGARLKK